MQQLHNPFLSSRLCSALQEHLGPLETRGLTETEAERVLDCPLGESCLCQKTEIEVVLFEEQKTKRTPKTAEE